MASVPAYFLLRIASGLLLLKLSTSVLPVAGFATFSQLMLFAALLNLVAIGGAQNGLIRQAAAARDAIALGRTQAAALLIWACIAPLVLIATAIAGKAISGILVGTPDEWPAVIAIATLALAAGPGQIWCSILSGQRRVTSSLGAQAIGLIAGTTLAASLTLYGDPVAAAIGFAGGPFVTMALACRFASDLRLIPAPLRAATAEVRILMRYSIAFAATTATSAILLFALRSFYRAAFGTAALGYWLVANRISDMSTQFLGLFMIQFFVPHVAMLHDAGERDRLVLRCWAAGVAVMATAPVMFWIAARPLVHVFLSDAFLPAIPVIQTYMIGDTLRVWASLAMYAAFARGRPGRYAAIEIATLTAMGIVTILLITAGDAQAPQRGYAGAYALAAAAVTLGFLRRRKSRR